MNQIRYEIFTEKNVKYLDKPNEDLALFEKKYNIGIVLDGVTRDRIEGVYPNPSPARVASELFANTIINKFEEINTHGKSKICELIQEANKNIKIYNEELRDSFLAGTVGIIFVIEGDKFHYAYIGDCSAGILRNDMYRVFTEKQTVMIQKHKHEYTSKEIRTNICNHINHPCGYGVWNGEPEAMDFVKYGTIKVQPGDIVLLYTDGFEEEMKGYKISNLCKEPLKGMSKERISQDDKTFIKLKFL